MPGEHRVEPVFDMEENADRKLRNIVQVSGSEKTRAADMFKGQGASTKMEKWQLPGDDVHLAELKFVTNVTPLMFIIPFIAMTFFDGFAYMQETPTRWTNGTLYKGTEEGIEGMRSDSVAIEWDGPAAFRTTRDDLFFPSDGNGTTLTCDYGKPQAYWGADKGHFCPMVLKQDSSFAILFVWFSLFVILVALACCRGNAIRRSTDRAHKQNRTHSNRISRLTSPLTYYLGFYGKGLGDEHLHLWIIVICLLFVHSLLARSWGDECSRFGDWDANFDRCLPLGATDTFMLNIFVFGNYVAWMGMLWQVDALADKTPPSDKTPFNTNCPDPVMRAAINMKARVHKQVSLLRKNHRQKPQKPFMDSVKEMLLKAVEVIMLVKANGNEGPDENLDFLDAFTEGFDDVIEHMGNVTTVVEDATHEIEDLKSKGLDEKEKIENAVGRKIYCTASAPAFAGLGLGLVMFFIIVAAPGGALYPIKAGDGFGGKFCNDEDVWCNGQSVGTNGLGGAVFYAPETGTMLSTEGGGYRADTIILSIIKCCATVITFSLYTIMVSKLKEPFEEAAWPMQTLGHIMMKWTVERNVTLNQLSAWNYARRSFLRNECSLLLKNNAACVFGFVVVVVFVVALQVAQFFAWDRQIGVPATIAIILSSIGAFTCIQAAMACFHAQRSHRHLLKSLKQALIGKEDIEAKQEIRSIEAILNELETMDHQTKLFFLPLNPTLLKGLVGYLSTAVVAVAGKLLVST